MCDNIKVEPEVILCDMCTEEDRKPARKTCMKCEISMCVQHLQAHLTTPVLLQSHPLTEPMPLCGTTKCHLHGKVLEYYCLDDMTCVCVSCAIEDLHRLHNMKTFATAHKELMEKLNVEQKALQEKTEDKNVSLEQWEKSEREKLGASSVRLIEAVTNLRDICLTSVQSSVAARMVAIKTSKKSIEAAQKEKDTFRFLQMYSQVHQDVEKAKAVDLRKGLEPCTERDKLVQEIRQNGENMMNQASEFGGSLLTLVDPENHQKLFDTDLDQTFDPKIFGPGISLSKDSRKVFYSSWMGECAATLLIRTTKSVSNFQRLLVSLSEEYDWTVGLCDKESALNLKDGPLYGLCCENNQLSSLTTECDDGSGASTNSGGLGCPQPKKPRRVSSKTILQRNEEPPDVLEVFWNVVASSLSFYRRTGEYQREEIITMNMRPNNSDLVPFVRLGKEDVQRNSDWSNITLKCPCGMVYDRETNMSGSLFGSSACQRNKCSCGEIIGRQCITEMICEIL